MTTVPPVADTTIWEHPSLQHALGKKSPQFYSFDIPEFKSKSSSTAQKPKKDKSKDESFRFGVSAAPKSFKATP